MRKTWVWLGGRKRPPGDYEELSTGVQWYGDPLSNTELGGWREDNTVIKADWDNFRDPTAMYYRTYVAAQDAAERQLDSVFTVAKDADFVSAIDEQWRRDLVILVGALAHAEWGVSMAHQHVQRFTLSPTIGCSAQLQVMDKLRAAERCLEWYNLAEADAPDGLVHETWMTAEAIQPLRKYLEEALIVQDWSEVIIAINVGLLGVMQPFLRELYVKGGRAHGDFVTAALGAAFAKDGARHTAWTDAFVKFIQTEDVNAAPLAEWLDRYVPAGVAAMAALVAAVPMDGISANALTTAKSELRARLEALDVPQSDHVLAALGGGDDQPAA